MNALDEIIAALRLERTFDPRPICGIRTSFSFRAELTRDAQQLALINHDPDAPLSPITHLEGIRVYYGNIERFSFDHTNEFIPVDFNETPPDHQWCKTAFRIGWSLKMPNSGIHFWSPTV